VPGPARPFLKPVLAALRRWDRHAAARPNLYVANSRHVADEIKRLYRRQAVVINPPVSLDRFAPLDTPREGANGCYLVVARLLPYKRVDLAIKACMRRGARLVVVGEGPEQAALMRLAGKNIEFRPRLDDAELSRLYASAYALLQCGMEDFGIAPLEANASGRPVAAYAAGGALDTVIEGRTGVLFERQTEDSIYEALDRLETKQWNPDELRKHAASFGEERFAAQMRSTIQAALGRAEPKP
jgi:glycosyltransferase involved in cell wall biosynthesis